MLEVTYKSAGFAFGVQQNFSCRENHTSGDRFSGGRQFKLENILDENSVQTGQADSLVRTALVGKRNCCRACSGAFPVRHAVSKALPVQHKFPRIAALELTTAIVSWVRG